MKKFFDKYSGVIYGVVMITAVIALLVIITIAAVNPDPKPEPEPVTEKPAVYVFPYREESWASEDGPQPGYWLQWAIEGELFHHFFYDKISLNNFLTYLEGLE